MHFKITEQTLHFLSIFSIVIKRRIVDHGGVLLLMVSILGYPQTSKNIKCTKLDQGFTSHLAEGGLEVSLAQ